MSELSEIPRRLRAQMPPFGMQPHYHGNDFTEDLSAGHSAAGTEYAVRGQVMTAQLKLPSNGMGHPWQTRTFELNTKGDDLCVYRKQGDPNTKKIRLQSVHSISITKSRRTSSRSPPMLSCTATASSRSERPTPPRSSNG